MQRAIVGYHQDEKGDWVAELACGHERHVRHRPPFQLAPWVVEAGGRQERLGSPIDCGLCDDVSAAPPATPDSGGEPACFVQVVCPDCGIVLDGSPHRPNCTSA